MGFFPPNPDAHEAVRQISETDILSKAIAFISYCKANHRCGHQAEMAALPYRALELKPHINEVKLVQQTSNNVLRAQYIGLSHCWDLEHPLKTTKQNISSHIESLPWDHIPKPY
jgi:hypothetical protein